ncbi:MAG: hypothetical protein D6690_06135, partial [Nitrospirae bacterium]
QKREHSESIERETVHLDSFAVSHATKRESILKDVIADFHGGCGHLVSHATKRESILKELVTALFAIVKEFHTLPKNESILKGKNQLTVVIFTVKYLDEHSERSPDASRARR